MKAYFTASLSGKGQYKEHYITIVNTLKRLGYEVIADHILKTDPSEVIQQEVEDVMSFYKRMQQWVKSSNVIVAEVSNPSTSVGYEIALALEMEKPVIALYLEGREPTLLKGNVSEYLLAMLRRKLILYSKKAWKMQKIKSMCGLTSLFRQKSCGF